MLIREIFFLISFGYKSICGNFWITLFIWNDPTSRVPFKGAKTSQNLE